MISYPKCGSYTLIPDMIDECRVICFIFKDGVQWTHGPHELQLMRSMRGVRVGLSLSRDFRDCSSFREEEITSYLQLAERALCCDCGCADHQAVLKVSNLYDRRYDVGRARK